MRKYLFLLYIAITPAVISGQGFQQNTQGAKSFSMGGAFTALSEDASSVFHNPGSLVFLKQNMGTGGIFLSRQKLTFLSSSKGNIKADNPLTASYYLYLNYNLNEKMSAGISINQPFGSNIRWNDDWEGRYVVQEAKFKTTFIQPTFSYKINDKAGIGAGLMIGPGSLTMRKALPIEGNAPYGKSLLKGNGTGIGFNIGAFGKINEAATVGLNYRSSVKLNIKKGEATFSDIASSMSDLFPSGSLFSTEIDLPYIFSAGIAYKFTPELITTFQIEFAGWSSFNSLNYIFENNPELNTFTERNYKNTVAARIGGQYSFTEEFDLRVGGAFQQSPAPDNHLSPEFPHADMVLLSAGAGYKINDKLKGDFTLGIENHFERKGVYEDADFEGSYKSSRIIAGVGLNYIFEK